ncbi:carboxypeptidase regulatory-like domain-containing protein [Reinekea forsetii]|uniref:Putative lipoprotein n=1 Tax=Reinekea forsetii TaxID=1336806 RepID=A0A2K8KY34_9GAMM|nr:carboxypeptidase regulatory-like domain-containing protein [Reinekea forsetii]ATX77436.1 putative lipoprotein [Reinekea forsetii]
MAVSHLGNTRAAQSDSDGLVTLTGLPAGSHTLALSLAGYVSATRTFEVASDQEVDLGVVELTNEKGKASGQIIVAEMDDYANVLVYARDNQGSIYTSISDINGFVSFPALPVGQGYSFITSANGYQSEKLDEVDILLGETADIGRLVLTKIPEPIDLTPKPGNIAGFVYFADKQDALNKHAGVIISVEGTDKEAISSRNGAFVINGLPPGTYSLNFTDSNHTTKTLSAVEVVSETTNQLDSQVLDAEVGNISGTLLDANSNPVAGALLTITGTGQTTTTDSTGGFLFSSVFSGDFSLNIQKTGYANTQRIVSVPTNEQTLALGTLNIEAFRLSGAVVKSSGNDHSGIAVSLIGTAYSTTTDTAGNFEFIGIERNNYTLQYSYAGYQTGSQLVSFDELTQVSLDAVTLEQYRIDGVVELSGLSDFSGVTVSLVGTSYSAVTDSDGSFSITGFVPGSYELRALKSGFQSTTLLVNTSKEAPTLSIADALILKMDTGKVSGVVTLENQAAHAGVLVELLGSDFSALTDNQGQWQLDVPVANYSGGIRYQRDLYSAQTTAETVTVTALGVYQAQTTTLVQAAKRVQLALASVASSCSQLQLTIEGQGSAAGFTASYPDAPATIELNVPFGDYQYTLSCIDPGFETIIRAFSVDDDGLQTQGLDSAELRVRYVKINNAALYTNSPTVSLAIGSTDASEMRISQGSADSDWIAFSASMDFTMQAGDGLKTLVVDFRNSSGVLPSVIDQIILDTTIVVKGFTAEGATTRGDVLHLSLDLAGETAATVSVDLPGLVNGLALVDNGTFGDVTANDGHYERDYVILSPAELTVTPTATIVDRAANSITVTAAPVVLSTAPSIGNLSVASNVASGEMTIKFSTDEPTTSLVNYGFDASNLTEQLTVSDTWTSTHQIVLTGLPANTLTYFEITAEDAAANQTLAFGQGKLAPAPITGLGAHAGNAEVGLIWDASANNELAGYQLYRSSDSGISYTPVTAELIDTTFYVDATTNDQDYYYQVTAVDLDGNESIDSSAVNVTPSALLAGPTLLNGGLIDSNTVWLGSRSPYQITAPVRLIEDVTLLMLPGAELEFAAADQYMLVSGQLEAHGTAAEPVRFTAFDAAGVKTGSIRFDNNNSGTHRVSNAQLSYVDIYSYDPSQQERQYSPVNLQLTDASILLANNYFSVNRVTGGKLEFESNHYSATIRITNLSGSVVDSVNDSQNNYYYSTTQLDVGSMSDTIVHNATFNSLYNTSGSQFTGATLNYAQLLTDSVLQNSQVQGSTNLTMRGNTLVNSSVSMRQSYGRLTMRFNSLDALSTLDVSATLDISNNYWSTTDLADILERTGYSSDQSNDTHLYPIISGSDLLTADADGDGLPDYVDYDNDNDGYSDLQEDWSSDPLFGSIYNPLDPLSAPTGSQDNDMDGQDDLADLDDDNDGLADETEVVMMTNPYLADTDWDGSNDGIEVSLKYSPVDSANHPLSGKIANVRIDNSNINSDGLIYITGGTGDNRTELNSVSVAPGSVLMLDRDAEILIKDSQLHGTPTNAIRIESDGAGSRSSALSIENSQLSYLVHTSAKRFNVDATSTIDFADLNVSAGYLYGTIENSAVFGSWSLQATARVRNSYLGGQSLGGGLLENSFHTGSSGMSSMEVKNSIFAGSIYPYDSTLTNSWVNRLYYHGEHSSFVNSDIELVSLGTSSYNYFFDGSYIGLPSDSTDHYFGLGDPVDELGDDVATTEFEVDSYTIKVDGITNPRDTPVFGLSAPQAWQSVVGLWDPTTVGVWWDMNEPTRFQTTDPDTRLGILSGTVQLGGYTDSSGVTVSINSTGLSTTTDADGYWEIKAPARSYTGLLFAKEHFADVTKVRTYTVLANSVADAGAVTLEQQTGRILGVLTVDDALDVTLATLSATSINGSYSLTADASGVFDFAHLPLATYSVSLGYAGGSWETRVFSVKVKPGQTDYDLGLVRLKNSFVYIDDDALYTNTRAVVLSLANAQAVTMAVSENGVSSAAVAMANSYALTLSAGDGVKTVTVAFFDEDGTALTAANDSIELDSTVSLQSLTLSSVATRGDRLTVTLDAGEAGGTASYNAPGLISALVLVDDGTGADSAANDGLYSAATDITTFDDFANLSSSADFIDRAGNSGTLVATSLLNLSTQPTLFGLLTQTVDAQLVVSFSTSEATTAVIWWGYAPGSLTNSVVVSATESTEHQIALAVAAGQTVYYEVRIDDSVTTIVAEQDSSQLAFAPVASLSGQAGYSETGLVWSEQANATAYRVYRSLDANHFTAVADVAASQNYYVDNSALNDTTYYYRVTWLNQSAVESDRSAMVTLTPTLAKAGPTEVDGGVLAVHTLWLKSRSPYLIIDNMLIKENASLNLMAGTQVQFNGADKHIYLKGRILAHGSEADRVSIESDPTWTGSYNESALIFDLANSQQSQLRYADVSRLKIYKSDTSLVVKSGTPSITLDRVQLSLRGEYSSNFSVQSLSNSQVTFDGCSGNSYLGAIDSSQLTKSTLGSCDSYQVFRASTVTDSTINDIGFRVDTSIRASTLTNAYMYSYYAVAETLVVINSDIYSNTTLVAEALDLTNSRIDITGSNSWLRLSRSTLDMDSSVSAVLLDIDSNYWGTTDIANIGERTGYISNISKGTHLYPVISSADIDNADFDGDGTPDIADHDNDGDGYSDLQEDWESDPAYGSVFDPLDANSYPTTSQDNDMDGVVDSLDLDDDNDGIADADEPTYGTSPYLADTDGDGVNDNLEISTLYDPLDRLSHPLVGSHSNIHIDASYNNSAGNVVLLATSLSNISIDPGIVLMMDRDADVEINNSTLAGTAAAPIFIRSSGAGTGRISFTGVAASYLNIKLPVNFYVYAQTTLDRSDIWLTDSSSIDDGATIENSSLFADATVYNYGLVQHSMVRGAGSLRNQSSGQIITSRLATSNTLYSSGIISDSVISSAYNYSNSSIMGSIVSSYNSGSSYSSLVVDSDVELSYGRTWATLFSNSFLTKGSSSYSGSGLPVDIIGDGVAETEFVLDGSTFTVDGIVSPRSTANFPGGESDLWDPTGVGALWDSANPTLFPDPL